ncbi:MAG: hypothetical protein BWY32_03870 [bacterium ADurb.Bin243]|jgi:hypothetical protein|nr:MAG: hypothetical protein BWY32_03870 [bacterium ADurb.Bin243]
MDKILEIISRFKEIKFTGKTVIIISVNQGGIISVEEYRKK